MNAKRIVIALCLLFPAAGLFAAGEPLVIYSAGRAEVQDARGRRRPADIGDLVLFDETLITGKGGRITLQSRDGVFDVFENTVLRLMQAQKGGKKQNAYLCALGRVGMKVNKLSTGDPGPRLGSTSAAAGVKGTELDVYAGADGSSLVLVTEGAVDVESRGATVTLAANEGVEVTPGRAPGAKFVIRNPIDYRSWNESKFDEFFKDPIAGINALKAQMKRYSDEIETLYKEYQLILNEKKIEDIRVLEIEKNEGKDSAKKYFQERIAPLDNNATLTYLNIRFDARSALSLRRFVVGRMYLFMRTKYYNKSITEEYKQFIIELNFLLDDFNNNIVKYLVEADV